MKGSSSYGSSKETFVRVLDFVVAENPSMRVTNIQPGVIKTDMAAKAGLDLTYDDGEHLP